MKKSYVIALVGAGGKTSMIRRIAQIASGTGRNAAVMTTTHMWLPKEHSGVGKTPQEAARLLKEEGILYYGQAGQGKAEGKMTFPGQEAYEYLCGQAEFVLVEADGSRCLPMKFPDWPREPVIPANTDAVFVMFGLSAVGQPLSAVCHRWQLGLGKRAGTDLIAQKSESVPVTPSLAADFLERGYLRPIRYRFPSAPVILFLNQADTAFRRKAGEQMQSLLHEKGWDCRLCSLRPMRIAVIYMASGFGSRFGTNKLLKPYRGKPLYRHGLDLFLTLKEEMAREDLQLEILVVSQYQEILEEGMLLKEGEEADWQGEKADWQGEDADWQREKAGWQGETADWQREMMSGKPLEKPPHFWTVENLCAEEGITSSLRLGVKSAGEEIDGYLFSVADQPWLSLETMRGLLRQHLDGLIPGQKDISCLTCNGRRGNPVLFDRTYREQLLALTGDKGGSRIMKKFPERVMEYAAGERELKDIDYPEDLQ